MQERFKLISEGREIEVRETRSFRKALDKIPEEKRIEVESEIDLIIDDPNIRRTKERRFISYVGS